jgi:hypothetical protein
VQVGGAASAMQGGASSRPLESYCSSSSASTAPSEEQKHQECSGGMHAGNGSLEPATEFFRSKLPPDPFCCY